MALLLHKSPRKDTTVSKDVSSSNNTEPVAADTAVRVNAATREVLANNKERSDATQVAAALPQSVKPNSDAPAPASDNIQKTSETAVSTLNTFP